MRAETKGIIHPQTLDQALDLFWRKGFEGTAKSDLTEAMFMRIGSLGRRSSRLYDKRFSTAYCTRND
jgi:hypothetical protein